MSETVIHEKPVHHVMHPFPHSTGLTRSTLEAVADLATGTTPSRASIEEAAGDLRRVYGATERNVWRYLDGLSRAFRALTGEVSE